MVTVTDSQGPLFGGLSPALKWQRCYKLSIPDPSTHSLGSSLLLVGKHSLGGTRTPQVPHSQVLHSPWVAHTPWVVEGVGHGAEGSWLEGHGCEMAGQLMTPQVHRWPAVLPRCVPARSRALHMHARGTTTRLSSPPTRR